MKNNFFYNNLFFASLLTISNFIFPASIFAQDRNILVGSSYIQDIKSSIYLHGGPCKDRSMIATRPFNSYIQEDGTGRTVEGCWSYNQSTQQIDHYFFAPINQSALLPYSGFNLTTARIADAFNLNNSPSSQASGGGIVEFLRAAGDGLNRATTYWNNSAAQTQRNTTNLTPGLTGGNQMNCVPDGRGGYNCR